MPGNLTDDLTAGRQQVRLNPMLSLSDHEYAHERGICVDSCPFCGTNKAMNMSNQFDTPIDMNVGNMQGCMPRNPSIFDDIHKIPLTVKEPVGTALELTLQARGQQYGDYTRMATVAQKIKEAMFHGGFRSSLTAVQRESLDLIATKIARIVCGDPNLPDNWLDIEGYAKLARDRLPDRSEPATPLTQG